jgi:hypothetical protein
LLQSVATGVLDHCVVVKLRFPKYLAQNESALAAQTQVFTAFPEIYLAQFESLRRERIRGGLLGPLLSSQTSFGFAEIIGNNMDENPIIYPTQPWL